MIRGIGLREAVAVNVITMIGIGPLITIPIVLTDLHGSTALVAWIVGAVVALCDGLAWAELGSLYPGSGGTYVFLRETFGPRRFGRMLAFLFAWQILLSGPLLLASGYIGFAHYAGYLWAPLASDARLQGIVAAAVGVLTLVLLYRRIDTVAALSVGLAGVALATLGAIVVASAGGFAPTQAFASDPHLGFVSALAAGLGPALVITLYDYAGYGASCSLGDETIAPVRVLPRSVVLSIVGVGLVYITLQIGVLGVVPWRELVASKPGGAIPDAANYVASLVVERVWGYVPARIVTIAILATAFASTFGNLLGYSRIPYAAAVDGVFLRPFAKLDERGRFPSVALLAIGLLALPACFLSLGDVINALTAGLVVVQSIAQLIAIAVLRARGVRAPYRMWAYPLPALIALSGWVYIFFSSGTRATVFGVLSLALGVSVFAWRARRAAEWPFARKAATILALALGVVGADCFRAAAADTARVRTTGRATNAPAAGHATIARQWGHAAIVERDGASIFEVDGKPFFVYGAAFFYERLPRDSWRPSMLELREMGINTLDLYVPWNWHELTDGDFDFDGRTSPRRDLHEVLRLARELDFKIILRPGPVVRNEWRNGGYPAWLLARPEYGMPLHDLLEGRYPPTATLQNAHSDDAAAEWMRNATHVTYARRWLERVLHECEPVADRIVAVALDDDQGAYIDNQTYPAPHLQAYLAWLSGIVHGVTGAGELTFINTYQMKVTASSPVWAMGNWYQSDAYAIGEHDRAQLEFSTGLLHTRPHQPLMASEFQAGWLQGPGEGRPRPADPSNTALAIATMMGLGVRGIVNFPAQDTLYPSGWEAPFANAFYAWDAALRLDGSHAPRYEPTAQIGALVSLLGPQLAGAQTRYDAAIAYTGASFPAAEMTSERFAAIAARTIEAQHACRSAGFLCALVDPHAFDDVALARYRVLVIPAAGADTVRFERDTALRIERYRIHGGILLAGDVTTATLQAALRRAKLRPSVSGIPGASFAPDPSGVSTGFLSVPNYSNSALDVPAGSVALAGGELRRLPPFSVPAHAALVTPLGLRMSLLDPRFSKDQALDFTDCMPSHFKIVTATPHVAKLLFEFETLAGAAPARSCEFAYHERGRARIARVSVDRPGYYTLFDPGADGRIGGPTLVPNATSLLASDTTPASSVVVRNDATLLSPSLRASPTPHAAPAAGFADAYRADVYADGAGAVVLENGRVRLIVAPQAGARAFVFEDLATGRNIFTTVGGMRDDVALEPPLSSTDRIAKYTHQFPAGTFNRTYADEILESGSRAMVRFSYDAPDVPPSGATFSRTVTLAPGARTFEVAERFAPRDGGGALGAARDVDAAAQAQRAVAVTSLTVGDGPATNARTVFSPQATPFAIDTTQHVSMGNALGFYDGTTREFATIAWHAGDVEEATMSERRFSLVARLTLAPGRTTHLRYGYERAETPLAARIDLAAADSAAQYTTQGAKPAARTSFRAGKWRNGLRDRLKSD